MAIDLASESPIPFSQAAAHLPRRRGRKPAVSTLHRWATAGLRGVVLETLQVGGTRCTSLAALQRFFDRLSALNSPTTAPRAEGPGRTGRAERVEQELNMLW